MTKKLDYVEAKIGEKLKVKFLKKIKKLSVTQAEGIRMAIERFVDEK